MSSVVGYNACAIFFRLAFLPFIRRRILNAHHIPQRGACILAPNHISHFDPPLVGISTGRPVDWMAMRELFANPLLGGALRGIGSFPVTRSGVDRMAIRTAMDRLHQGKLVGIFPEGGLRTGPQSILNGAPVKPGVALLSQLTEAPVTPCVIIGSDALYTPSRWLPWRRCSVWIVFGEPLPPPDKRGGGESRTDFSRRLGGVFQEIYERTVQDEQIPVECLPQTPQRRKGRE